VTSATRLYSTTVRASSMMIACFLSPVDAVIADDGRRSLHEVTAHTGLANKNRTFLNVDNFAMVSGRKACDMSKVCKFCRKKYKTCIEVCLNILCLICINIHYP